MKINFIIILPLNEKKRVIDVSNLSESQIKSKMRDLESDKNNFMVYGTTKP